MVFAVSLDKVPGYADHFLTVSDTHALAVRPAEAVVDGFHEKLPLGVLPVFGESHEVLGRTSVASHRPYFKPRIRATAFARLHVVDRLVIHAEESMPPPVEPPADDEVPDEPVEEPATPEEGES